MTTTGFFTTADKPFISPGDALGVGGSVRRRGFTSQPPGKRGESEEMNTTKEINSAWSAYDQSVAKCHLINYGIIFLDKYGVPIDDEFLTDELFENLK